MFARFIRDDQGQDLIEYLLLGSFVSIGALLGATLLGTELNGWYSDMGSWVNSASASAAAAVRRASRPSPMGADVRCVSRQPLSFSKIAAI